MYIEVSVYGEDDLHSLILVYHNIMVSKVICLWQAASSTSDSGR